MKTFAIGVVLGALISGVFSWLVLSVPPGANRLHAGDAEQHQEVMAALREVQARLNELERLPRPGPRLDARGDGPAQGERPDWLPRDPAGHTGPGDVAGRNQEGAPDPERVRRADEARTTQAKATEDATEYLDKALLAGVWTDAHNQEFQRILQPLGPRALPLRQRLTMALNSGKLKRQ